jgi:hypothetical protein
MSVVASSTLIASAMPCTQLCRFTIAAQTALRLPLRADADPLALVPVVACWATASAVMSARNACMLIGKLANMAMLPLMALYTVTPGMLTDPGGVPALSGEENEVFWALREHVEQLRHPLPGQRKRHMKDESKVVESFDKAMASILARLPPEQRLAGLAPEQRLAGLAPEQRLAGLAPEQVLRSYAPEQRLMGLTEAQAVLALPDAVLRGLSDEYLATLPRETRAAIQKRLAGAAASPDRRARGRRSR